MAVEGVVIAPILEFRPNAAADLNHVVIGDRQVAQVEEVVQVGTQQEAVVDLVRAVFRIALVVRGLQSGKRALTGHGAAPLVGVGDQEPKCPLPKARSYHLWLAIAILRSFSRRFGF